VIQNGIKEYFNSECWSILWFRWILQRLKCWSIHRVLSVFRPAGIRRQTGLAIDDFFHSNGGNGKSLLPGLCSWFSVVLLCSWFPVVLLCSCFIVVLLCPCCIVRALLLLLHCSIYRHISSLWKFLFCLKVIIVDRLFESEYCWSTIVFWKEVWSSKSDKR